MSAPNSFNTYLPPVIQIPSALTITAATQSNPMTITVSANTDQVNTYISGQKVILNIPQTYGMWQANGQSATITNVNGNVFTLNINSLLYDPFTVPPAGSLGPATVAPNGSMNLQYSNSTNQVGFQSYNNVGN